ncbi:uncharacterized protein LOC135708606 [Ochlerotatus camptorhynchus]|uniref:uncharacterized protein LOC135708606 n=1 Tax=Ochlerotatus camptorhynchus TaxID=644619 RepID=UPI0031DB26F6
MSPSINESIVELMFLASKISSPADRVRVTEWIKKLSETATEADVHSKLVEEYLEYLKMLLSSSPIYFVDPFKNYPPKQKLAPLAESLGNSLANECPYLPRSGPLKPIVLHRSDDDTAVISVNQNQNGEVLCYMAIAPRNE